MGKSTVVIEGLPIEEALPTEIARASRAASLVAGYKHRGLERRRPTTDSRGIPGLNGDVMEGIPSLQRDIRREDHGRASLELVDRIDDKAAEDLVKEAVAAKV